jgi:uncharacterized protein DUF6089
MKRLIISLITLLLFSTEKAAAQYYFYNDNYYETKFQFEAGASVGIMNCLTDVGGKIGFGGPFLKDLNIGNTKFAYGAYLSATYNYAYALRIEYTQGEVSAYDSILKPVANNSDGRYQRNLSFRSSISEIAVIAEFHPLFMFKDWAASDDAPPRFSPYLAIGVGHFHFDPQGEFNGQWYDLQPLHTEGEGWVPGRPEYKLDQYNIPIGIGVRYEATEGLNVRFEIMDRLLFTDYLDDVSTTYIDPTLFQTHLDAQDANIASHLAIKDANTYSAISGYNATTGSIRGNPHNNDNYFTVNLKVGIILGRQKID